MKTEITVQLFDNLETIVDRLSGQGGSFIEEYRINDFYFSKLNKKITKEAAKILLSTGRIRVTGIKSKKTKRNFSATVYMTVDNDCRPKYEMSFK